MISDVTVEIAPRLVASEEPVPKSLRIPIRWRAATQLPGWLPIPVLVCGPLVVLFLISCAVRVPMSVLLGVGPFIVVGIPLYFIDRIFVRPAHTRVSILLWGASVSVIAAIALELPMALVSNSTLALSGVAGPIEELAMFSGLWWIARKVDVVTTLDAVMLISWCALGFAAVEDVGYFTAAPHHLLVATFIVRAVVTPFAHPLFSSVSAVGYVWYRRRGQIGWLIGGIAGAALMHSTWDGTISWVADNNGVVSRATLSAVMVVYLSLFFGLFATWLVLVLVGRSREKKKLAFRLPHAAYYAGLPGAVQQVVSSQKRRLAHRKGLAKEARAGFDAAVCTLESMAHRDGLDPLQPVLAYEAFSGYYAWSARFAALPVPIESERINARMTLAPPDPCSRLDGGHAGGALAAPDPESRLDKPKAPNILVVDNYDSFVYNIVQYLAELGAHVTVRRNDKVSALDIAGMGVDGVLVSPGPGYPIDAGNCIEIIRYCYEQKLSMFGVCLGHQALGEAMGGEVVRAPHLMHGKASRIDHSDSGVFVGVPSPMIAGRYHSLVVDFKELPECFEVTATCDGLIMGIRHKEAPLEGVQFHPESVLTQNGYRLLANWLATCGSEDAVARSVELDRNFGGVRAKLPQTAMI